MNALLLVGFTSLSSCSFPQARSARCTRKLCNTPPRSAHSSGRPSRTRDRHDRSRQPSRPPSGARRSSSAPPAPASSTIAASATSSASCRLGRAAAPRQAIGQLLDEERRLEETRATGEATYSHPAPRRGADRASSPRRGWCRPRPQAPDFAEPEAELSVPPLPFRSLRGFVAGRVRSPDHRVKPYRQPGRRAPGGLAVALADALAERGGGVVRLVGRDRRTRDPWRPPLRRWQRRLCPRRPHRGRIRRAIISATPTAPSGRSSTIASISLTSTTPSSRPTRGSTAASAGSSPS